MGAHAQGDHRNVVSDTPGSVKLDGKVGESNFTALGKKKREKRLTKLSVNFLRPSQTIRFRQFKGNPELGGNGNSWFRVLKWLDVELSMNNIIPKTVSDAGSKDTRLTFLAVVNQPDVAARFPFECEGNLKRFQLKKGGGGVSDKVDTTYEAHWDANILIDEVKKEVHVYHRLDPYPKQAIDDGDRDLWRLNVVEAVKEGIDKAKRKGRRKNRAGAVYYVHLEVELARVIPMTKPFRVASIRELLRKPNHHLYVYSHGFLYVVVSRAQVAALLRKNKKKLADWGLAIWQ